ncbi:MAG: hypothetical protein P8Y53_21425 [Pseudolabrys sp.]
MTGRWHRMGFALAAVGTLAALILPLSHGTAAGLAVRPAPLTATIAAAALLRLPAWHRAFPLQPVLSEPWWAAR